MCQEQSKSYRARAGKTFFATQAPTYIIISYVSKNVYSSHAKSMLPFSKHRSQDALRAGLVAIRSRQRVSERRSPEQGENGFAGCWPQKIHPHTQLLQAQAKTQSSRKHPRCKQSRTDFAQSSRKNAAGRNNRPRLTASRIAKLSEDGRKISAKMATGRQICAPTLYLEDTTASFKARTIFPKYPGYFDIVLQTMFTNIPDISRLRFSRNIWNISGNWSLQKMKPLHLPDYGRGSPDRFG